MKNFDLTPIKNFAENVCKIAACGVLMLASRKAIEYVDTKLMCVNATYDNAIQAIMGSDMLSSGKREAVMALKRDGAAELYSAVIRIAKDGSMFSSDKVAMIKALSGE